MEYPAHWATMAKCSLCGVIPESAPLYQCPFQHQYCFNCISELRKNYRGNIKGGSTCTICKISGVFAQSKINTDFLNKIKNKPGIGRPYRYNTNLINRGHNYSRAHEAAPTHHSPPPKITIERLFQLPSEEIRKILSRRNDSPRRTDSSTFLEAAGERAGNVQPKICTMQNGFLSMSKMPIKCPHNPCNKMVTLSSFVTHFKHEHADIPRYNIERGKELCIPCNVSIIEHDLSHCLAMITVYEINKIDVNKSKSSQSVIKTCSKFCQQVPINSFWLMVTGSAERRPHCSYAIYWLFTISDENYQSTIELSSKMDSVALSTFCGINTSKSDNFLNIAENLNCLIVTKASLDAILREGPEVNLRVTVH
ncbi:uncharacterized protein LOC108916008 [Anoplophora glabripennis]|uniref:uncharacterized protein LOC108916008 n=1 Tax=Anoplophora glabripennis TaxID=217634 RepID=UPI000874288E|nr:uncharacterized protein LOC108916008 [Anoplophora glabripennis]